jgi:hypothetical protein
MRLAIAGAGITGAYLYSKLRDFDYIIDLFDIEKDTLCNVH